MKILYVGPLWYGSTCLQRMEAMKELGHEVVPVDTEPAEVGDRQKHLSQRLRRKLVGPSDMAGANQCICQLVKEGSFDVLWLDKGLTITPESLRIVRQISLKTVIAGYSPDDMAAKHNQSRAFMKALPLYHVYFTTKSYGVKELEAFGVPRAIFVGNAYDPNTHFPMKIPEEERKRFGGSVGS